MSEGFTSDLVFEASIVAIMALLLAWRGMPAMLAVPAVLLRVGLPTLYFAEYFDGSLCMIDDVNYLNAGMELLRGGWNPLTALFTADGFEALSVVSGGHHFLYQWCNLLALYLFGEHYYAPVLLDNVLLSFVVAFVLNRLMMLLNFPQSYRIGLQLFYLLHWDVMTWLSYPNLKDTLVQVMTVSGLYCIVRFCQRSDWLSVVGFFLIMQLFYCVRFYLPVLMLLATVVWALSQWKDPRKYLLIPMACVGTYLCLHDKGDLNSLIDAHGFAYCFCVMVLAPTPLQTFRDLNYVHMPAATLHWLFLPPAILGMWQLWRMHRVARIFILYLLTLLAFYAMVEGFPGARHRVQVHFIIAWVQFQFLWSLRPHRPRRHRPSLVLSISHIFVGRAVPRSLTLKAVTPMCGITGLVDLQPRPTTQQSI